MSNSVLDNLESDASETDSFRAENKPINKRINLRDVLEQVQQDSPEKKSDTEQDEKVTKRAPKRRSGIVSIANARGTSQNRILCIMARVIPGGNV
jgi:hypothetical protein